MNRLAAAAALLALAGCGDGAPTNDQPAIRVANPDSDRLKALSPLIQRLGLMRAIRQSGHRCHRVDALGHQQYYRSMEMWVALVRRRPPLVDLHRPQRRRPGPRLRRARQLGLPVCRPVAPLPPDPNFPASDVEANAQGNAPGNAN